MARTHTFRPSQDPILPLHVQPAARAVEFELHQYLNTGTKTRPDYRWVPVAVGLQPFAVANLVRGLLSGTESAQDELLSSLLAGKQPSVAAQEAAMPAGLRLVRAL